MPLFDTHPRTHQDFFYRCHRDLCSSKLQSDGDSTLQPGARHFLVACGFVFNHVQTLQATMHLSSLQTQTCYWSGVHFQEKHSKQPWVLELTLQLLPCHQITSQCPLFSFVLYVISFLDISLITTICLSFLHIISLKIHIN